MKVKARPLVGKAFVTETRRKVTLREGIVTAQAGDYIVDFHGIVNVYSPQQFNALYSIQEDDKETKVSDDNQLELL